MDKFSWLYRFPLFSRFSALAGKFLKFSLVGAFTTLCSLSTQAVLLKFYHTPLIPTYVSVYGGTILLSYMLNSRLTFRSRITVKKALLYFGIYLSAMGLGVLLLHLYRQVLPFENWVLPFLVVPFTMAWNFSWANRYLKHANA